MNGTARHHPAHVTYAQGADRSVGGAAALYGDFGSGSYNPASILDLGSSKSRSASPIKLNDSTASITAMEGKETTCGESNRCPRPALSMMPQEGVGGGTARARMH